MEIRQHQTDAHIQELIEEIYGRDPFAATKQQQDWIQIAREVYKAQQYRKRYEELEKTLMTQLVEKSEHKESYGGGFKLEQIVRKGSVDYKAIPEIQDVDLDRYRKADSMYWKLSTAFIESIDVTGVL